MIRDRNIDPEGISNARLNLVVASPLGSPTVGGSAGSAAILTSQDGATFTAAAGTQPSAPRNLQYRMSCSSTVAFAGASGTLQVKGIDALGNTVSESVAVSVLVQSTGTAAVQGSVLFRSISASGITLSGLTLTSTNHAQSNNVSWYVGQGNHIALPNYISASGNIKGVQLGGSVVTAYTFTSGTFQQSNGSGLSYAGVNAGGANYLTTLPLIVWYQLLTP